MPYGPTKVDTCRYCGVDFVCPVCSGEGELIQSSRTRNVVSDLVVERKEGTVQCNECLGTGKRLRAEHLSTCPRYRQLP